MKKFTEQEKAAFRTERRKFIEKNNEYREQCFNRLPEELREFVIECCRVSFEQPVSKLYRELSEGLDSGRYRDPSDFLKERCEPLFDGYIYPRKKRYVYYDADRCARVWPYERESTWRRSFRTSDGSVTAASVMKMLYNYFERDLFDAELIDIMRDNLPPELIAVKYSSYFISYEPSAVACEIDSGNEEVISFIRDALCGDDNANISIDIFKGIIRSGNSELHELLGKLLVAARLQEGLRQAICESADEGTEEGFLTLLKVIINNDLIRFSSVKRAVGTWTGFISTGEEERASDIERVNNKLPGLLHECLTDASKREEYLRGEDSMRLYIALWSLGFYEAKDMLEKIRDISLRGSHHQILTAGYAAENLCQHKFAHTIAKDIIEAHQTEQDILAVYMNSFMYDAGRRIYNTVSKVAYENGFQRTYTDYEKRNKCDYTPFFDSTEEAEKFYDILKNIRNGINGKSADFIPCIFPWYGASLDKTDVSRKLIFLASAIGDSGRLDEASGFIGDLENRTYSIVLLLTEPDTDIRKKALAERVCDKETFARKAAFEVISRTEIPESSYRILEDMLRYKNAEMRANIIKLLYKQSDGELYMTAKRLISDKREEKRTAGLDILINLSEDEKRVQLFEKCRVLAAVTDKTTAKEKILIDRILGTRGKTVPAEMLYSKDTEYDPVPDREYIERSEKVFVKYYPPNVGREHLEIIDKLIKLFEDHFDDEFTDYIGEVHTLGSYTRFHSWYVPLQELWESFYATEINSPALLSRVMLTLLSEGDADLFARRCGELITKLAGDGYVPQKPVPYLEKLSWVCCYLYEKFADKEESRLVAAYAAYKLVGLTDDFNITYTSGGRTVTHSFLSCQQAAFLLSPLKYPGPDFAYIFPILYSLKQHKGSEVSRLYGRSVPLCYQSPGRLDSLDYLRAAFYGVISREFMYKFFFEEKDAFLNSGGALGDALNTVSIIYSGIREPDFPVSSRLDNRSNGRRFLEMMGRKSFGELTEEDKRFAAFCDEVYTKLTETVLSAELKRGDSETEYSRCILGINQIYGAEKFVAILTALGNDTFERANYFYWAGTMEVSKKKSLSYLLSVCVPLPGDNAEKLRELLKNSDVTEKRLIEAALYSSEWIDIVGEYLGWEGFKSACFYFIAHMNERFDDRRKALIARYTPLTADELNMGAFDINWFRSAYETLGEKRFDMIYDGAKYISDGSKHSRARKYADAVLGRLTAAETEKTVSDKRNKDLLMAYSLIPLKGEDDIFRRYLFLQKFLKESRQFGSQRSASEKKAVEIAMGNLAMNAGYSDTARLTLRMEAKLIDDSRELFEDKAVGDITVRLSVDESGKSEIICTKEGKPLKSVPARLKKNEYILRLTETKKQLTEQYRRARRLFEEAMEEGTRFTADELDMLRGNPVALPIVKDLIFACDGKLGFFGDGALTGFEGNVTKLKGEDMLSVAHPFALYTDGHWSEYQKLLFGRRTVQPFKQVFRELYIKAADERSAYRSLRYAGNQIQPAKTVACLKTRRWTADAEEGLQKVYYKENIVARIYAMADWFSPSDIECPTLEWVEFSDRKSGKPICIRDIPDIIFSEVMRDVDLAVSVAHAGGVDPETSASTVEMRAALLSFTLPLFGLKNVTVKGSHAHIEGKLADYTLHLGSGVIHKKGGAMLNILPVHSQHRGKLFLPFADDDPKTAEIISKAVFLAEDGKIKDPTVLEQIRR